VIAAFVATGLVNGANAAEKPWWPFPVHEFSTGKARVVDYVPLQEKASKKYHLVALLPHMKDKSWLAINYGLIMEAKRLGVRMTIFEAGGYENLTRQLSQYDDAVAMGADAILPGVISEAGLSKKIKVGIDKGITQVSILNPVMEAPFDGRVFIDSRIMGYYGGLEIIDYFKDKDKVRSVIFPGPQASGWAEQYDEGFRRALKEKGEGKIEILTAMYGDTGKSVQLKLVEDALQSYDNIDLLYGNCPMAEAAVNVLDEAGLTGKTVIMASYCNEDVIAAIRRGDMIGAVLEHCVVQARIGVDMAVRLLDNKPHGYGDVINPIPVVINPGNVNSVDLSSAFAPADYRPIYTLD
jgi:protein TorT